MMTIYGMPDSGNCYKPRLLCALTKRPFRHVGISTEDGGTRRPDYLAKNPNGKVPLLELEDGRCLPESNAILFYLGERTALSPEDPFARAEMLSWMFFEQYSHEPHIAVRRSLLVYPQMREAATPQRLADTLAGGHKALAVMEQRNPELLVGARQGSPLVVGVGIDEHFIASDPLALLQKRINDEHPRLDLVEQCQCDRFENS